MSSVGASPRAACRGAAQVCLEVAADGCTTFAGSDYYLRVGS